MVLASNSHQIHFTASAQLLSFERHTLILDYREHTRPTAPLFAHDYNVQDNVPALYLHDTATSAFAAEA